MPANSEKPAIGRKGRLDIPVLKALKHRCTKTFESIFNPFDRTTKQHRRSRNSNFLRMNDRFRAKSPANVWRDDAYLIFRQSQRLNEDGLRTVWHLSAVPNREACFCRVKARHQATRLNRMPSPLIKPERLGNMVSGTGKRTGQVAIFNKGMCNKIVWTIQAGLGCTACQPLSWINHNRERFQVWLHETCSIFGNATTLRDNDRQWLANIANLAMREPWRIDVELNHPGWNRLRNTIADNYATKVLKGINRDDARELPRLGDFDAAQISMGHGTADKDRMERAWEVNIIHKTRTTT